MELNVHFFWCICLRFSDSKWSSATDSDQLKGQNMIAFFLVNLLKRTFFGYQSRTSSGYDYDFGIFSLADLDDTLYPLSSGIAKSVLQNIQGRPQPCFSILCDVLKINRYFY